MFNENIDKLKKYLKDQRYYDSLDSLIGWDIGHSMPIDGREYSYELKSFLISQKLAKQSKAETSYLYDYFKSIDLNEVKDVYQRRAVYKFVKNYEKSTKIPEKFQIEFSNGIQRNELAWEVAYKNNDYKNFEPALKNTFDLCSQYAEYMDDSKNTLEVLCEDWDENSDIEEISALFTELKDAIIPMVKKISDSKLDYELPMLKAKYDEKLTADVCLDIIKKLMYDENRLAWGVRLHPVTTGIGPRDARITTNFKNFIDCLYSYMHEGGHGRYNSISNDKAVEYSLWGGQGGSIHESQSRFYENIIGHSEAFLKFAFPIIQEHIKEFRTVDFDSFYRGVNAVKPSCKRLESDELTYSIHPIIRFEIEKDYFDGNLNFKDIRDAWNEKYKKYLGVTPKTDAEGILQDLHWGSGYIGYFQSYTLGNLYDGQFLNAFLLQHPNDYKEWEVGNFNNINKWLYDNIHQYGETYDQRELIKNATNEKLKAGYFIDYLQAKYGKLYNF